LGDGVHRESENGLDSCAAGFLQDAPDPLRYDGHVLDPDEVTGIFASMIAMGDRVLDVGCGTGSITKILADTCRTEVIGIEPDAERAARAISRGLKVHIGRLNSELIRTTGLFDVVLFADVLEHLADPRSMLLTAREALRPRGSVIISVPNVAHWSVRAEMIFRGRFQYQATGIMDATHLRWFSADSARSLLASAGFRVTAYRATAGTTLLDNNMRRPLRWLPAKSRAVFLRFASRRWPTLFGCQHVLKGEMA
jgi:methionine biosynthesis protein MetW